MEAKLKTLMKDSISEVLSGMFFSPVEFSDDFELEEVNDFFKKSIIIAKILVESEILFEIYAVVQTEIMKDLTLNFTGKSNASEEDIKGSLMELLNMAGGEIVADFFKSRNTKLHIPEISSQSKFLNCISDKNTDKIFVKCNLLDGEIFFVGSLKKISN